MTQNKGKNKHIFSSKKDKSISKEIWEKKCSYYAKESEREETKKSRILMKRTIW